MASYLVQSGTSLYFVNPTTLTATLITLPAGITLYGSGTPCRAAVFGGVTTAQPQIIVVNGGTHDFWIDWTGTARLLQVSSPIVAPTLSAGAGTGLTGTYIVAATFKVKDANGTTIFETGLGPSSAGFAVVNTTILLNNIPSSADGVVNARGLYRTLTGGTTLYPWFDLDDNTTLSDDRGGSDALLSLLPTTASTYGAPPDLKLCVQWKDRLWGVPRILVDHLRWTEERVFYGWSATNEVLIPPTNTDSTGVTALIPRRDQLGVARRNRLYQITGESNDTFSRNQVTPNIGCLSQESVVVIRDVAYWLGEFGVVEWTSESIMYVSEAQVDAWFTSDKYFNRSLFSIAQGRYNPDIDAYELLLAGLDSDVLNMWVAFDLKRRCWLGPNVTDLPLACCGSDSEMHGYLRDADLLPIAVFGGSTGNIYKRDDVADDDNNPVRMDVILPVLGSFAPELEKTWLDPTLHSRVEPEGPGENTVTVTSSVGSLDEDGLVDDTDPVISEADLTQDYQRLDRPGTGRYVSFRFQHAAQGERVRIEGLEVPYTVIGRRDR